MLSEFHESLCRAPLVPTVFPRDVEALCHFARVLSEESYPAMEILARPLDASLEVFREICRRPERRLIRWGIGTIKTATSARAVLELRPDFLVSPAFSSRVLKECASAGIPYIPGVQTFQDVQDVLDAFDDLGLEVHVLKLCPIYGLSADYVQSLSNCFPDIAFCPTGEITLDNYSHWKQMPSIVAPMGSRLVPPAMLDSHDFAAIRQRLRQLRQLTDEDKSG